MSEPEQKIVPHLWYDQEASEAAEFYASILPDSMVTNVTTLHGTPSGDCDIVSFVLWGQKFMAISAGPLFKFNPSVSFILNFDPLFLEPSTTRETDAREKLEEVWERLSEGGMALMPLDRYPFSERYGWIQDRFGLSWQLMLTDPRGEPRPPIVPSMLFVGGNCGKAEEAINLYRSVFKNSRPGNLIRYGAGQEPDREGAIIFADFMLESFWLAARDSAHEHRFTFNEAISFMVYCERQEAIDHYWEHLSAVPEAEQCGWLKDRFGVSWQIVPTRMHEMMRTGTEEQLARLTQTFLQMKKYDVAALEEAFEGKYGA
jgi:predicted 3-demethylubiquinone-9 3-methyltransferase (glyoxalase superfamily)